MAAKKDSLALARRWKAGATNTLDLTKAAQWDFINDQYKRAGLTKSNEPKAYAALAAARKQGPGPKQKAAGGSELVPLNMIVSLGFSAGGTFATAISAIPGGTIISTLILELIDPANGTVLNTNTVSVFDEGECLPIEVTGPRPEGSEVEAIFTVNYQTGGKPIITTTRLIVSDRADGSPVVREPVKTSPDYYKNLRIALGANRGFPSYDYWYRAYNIHKPNLRLPLVGTQRYLSPVVKPFEPEITVNLVSPVRGGASAILPDSLDALRDSLKVSGNKVTWNMPWSAVVGKDRSMQFGSAAWGDLPVLLIFTLDVQTKKASAPVRTAIVSKAEPNAATEPGVANILPIDYLWR